jgi:hypothetical protein
LLSAALPLAPSAPLAPPLPALDAPFEDPPTELLADDEPTFVGAVPPFIIAVAIPSSVGLSKRVFAGFVCTILLRPMGGVVEPPFKGRLTVLRCLPLK